MGVRSDRRWLIAADRATVWAALCRVDLYRHWWPWLREFDGTRFAEGERWRCVVKPQLPYMVSFHVVLATVLDAELAVAIVDGDLRGSARLSLVDQGEGCQLRLDSDIEAAAGMARLVERWSPRLAAAGHDWVLDRGIRQFRANALPGRG